MLYTWFQFFFFALWLFTICNHVGKWNHRNSSTFWTINFNQLFWFLLNCSLSNIRPLTCLKKVNPEKLLRSHAIFNVLFSIFIDCILIKYCLLSLILVQRIDPEEIFNLWCRYERCTSRECWWLLISVLHY